MTKKCNNTRNYSKNARCGLPHTVQEIKSFLEQGEVFDYIDGQFFDSINKLLRNKTIKKVDRAVYTINHDS